MHEVGQIIFLVSRKAQSVLAAQICEQNVKKTLDGEETSFRVRIGTGDDDVDDIQLYDLDRVDADIYASPEEASESLYATAKSAIDSLVNEAVDDASKFFNYQRLPTKKTSTRRKSRKATTPKKPKSEQVQVPKKDDALYVTMPDGTQAKLKTPIDDIPVPVTEGV